MRVIAKLDGTRAPALLVLIVHGAPHRRMHVRVIQEYRKELLRACAAAGIGTPIDTTIDLQVFFVDPCSPDLDNLLVALYQAMDGATLIPPAVLADDGLIGAIRGLTKFYTG